MNRLFARTLLTILAALLILIALLASIMLLGLRRSIEAWDRTRTDELATVARQVLFRPTATPTIPENAPLFVYDAERKLVFSNRGEGARIRTAQRLTPIVIAGRTVGYYQTPEMQFRSDAANTRFLDSLQRSLWIGFVLSLVIALGFALVFSRTLSAPAERVARAIDRITRGDLSTSPAEGGAREIAQIGASADRLRLQLLREQGLRRQWLHDVAHDLRTPVAAIAAQFEGMRDGLLDVSPQRLERTLRELGRVQALIADLEELMRLESPEIRAAVELVEPAVLVEDAQGRFEQLLSKKDISFRSSVLSEPILVDPGLIHRALTNFLANAVRHCPVGGTVTITIRRSAGGVTVSVANTGDRIPEDDLARVFDRLYRGDYARSSAGSGLGLTIAKRIAELHGGTATISNRADGVIVEMFLPDNGAKE